MPTASGELGTCARRESPRGKYAILYVEASTKIASRDALTQPAAETSHQQALTETSWSAGDAGRAGWRTVVAVRKAKPSLLRGGKTGGVGRAQLVHRHDRATLGLRLGQGSRQGTWILGLVVGKTR